MTEGEDATGIIGVARRGFVSVAFRAITMLSTFFASVWAARCLGPEKLGVSGFVVVGVQLLNVCINILPSDYLVRAYHTSGSQQERGQFVREAASILFWIYLLAGWFALLVAGLCVGWFSNWTLSLVSGAFLLVGMGCGANWLLQAQEKQHRMYLNLLLVSSLTLLGNFAVIRVDSPAGTDLAVQAGAGIVGAVLAWRFAGYRWMPLGRVKALLAASHLRKSVWIFASAIVMYAYFSADLMLVGVLGGVSELGQYRTAHQLNSAIQGMLWMIPALLYPRFIAWARDSVEALWRRQLTFSLATLVVLALVVPTAFLLSERIYGVIYGEQYLRAARAFALLFASKMTMLAASFFIWGLWAQSRDKTMIGILVTGLFAEVFSSFILIPRMGMNGAAVAALLSAFLVFALSSFLSWRQAHPSGEKES